MSQVFLEPEVKIQHSKREYTVEELMEQIKRYRWLAQNLVDVLLNGDKAELLEEASQEEDPVFLEELDRYGGRSRRYRKRRLSTLRPAAPAKVVELRRSSDRPARMARPESQPTATVATPRPAPMVTGPVVTSGGKPRAPETQDRSEMGFRSAMHSKLSEKLNSLGSSAEKPPAPAGPQLAKVPAEEEEKFMKFRGVLLELLEASQFPHVKTLMTKAIAELSPIAVKHLEALVRQAQEQRRI